MATKQRFPWVAVSAVVSFVVVTAVAWLKVPQDKKEPAQVVTLPALALTQISPASSKQLLAEQLAAYDPAPLFIPSPMNSSEPVLPDEARSGASGPFPALPPELTKTNPLRFPSPVPIPKKPVDGLVLTERADAPLAMARNDITEGQLRDRLGQVEAVSIGSGRVVLTLDLSGAEDLPVGDWQPLELIGAVTRAGLAGELVVTASSGSAEIDDYFRSHLKRNVRIGARLSEGFYAFRVGP
jgi:hypothetical protein